MTTCHDIEILLTEYAAGELEAPARELVASHLEGCDSCRQEAAREALLRQTLGDLPVQPCPVGLDRQLGRLEPDPRSNRSGWPAVSGLVAAAVLAVVLLPGLLRQPATEVAVPAQRWTNQEIVAARKEMLYTLALTAAVLDRSSKNTMADIFGDRIPQAVTGSFKVKTTTRGGKG